MKGRPLLSCKTLAIVHPTARVAALRLLPRFSPPFNRRLSEPSLGEMMRDKLGLATVTAENCSTSTLAMLACNCRRRLLSKVS